MMPLLAMLVLSFMVAGGSQAARVVPVDSLCAPSVAEIVIRACDISQRKLNGSWTLAADETSPNGIKLAMAVYGPKAPDGPLADPADYLDLTFSARARTPYRLWLRMRASDDSSESDSVWVQFSDAQVRGRAAYRIGSGDALLVELEVCPGCGLSGWGWQDSSWSERQPATITFGAGGTHTLRIQAREPGVQIDQVVLSPVLYLEHAPGFSRDDPTVLRGK